MDRAQLKLLKEQFVSNLPGTTTTEIFALLGCLPLTILFGRLLTFLIELLVVVLPQVCMCMSLAPAEPTFLLLLPLWVALMLGRINSEQKDEAGSKVLQRRLQQLSLPRKRFISLFRGGLMLYTCIGILAVDFRAFPRRFAKAETYGTGLMDAGVGAIIFAGGLTSGTAASARVPGRGGHVARVVGDVARGVKAAAPMLVLGLGRLAATKAAEYQEHVGEYGVHWNFFFTVAAVGLLTQALQLPPTWLAPVGLLVTCLHQTLLTAGGWSPWVHAEARGPGLVSLNKEGLTSLWGYWAIHLLGGGIGYYVRKGCDATVAGIRARTTNAGGRAGAWPPVLLWLGRLLALDAALWLAMLLFRTVVEPVSRRACNASYVLWISALCLTMLIMTLLVDIVCPEQQPAPTADRNGGSSGAGSTGDAGRAAPLARAPAAHQLLLAVNRNMLTVFLVANLLTGAVNISINTLVVEAWSARGVVSLYMCALCTFAAVLDRANITVKFW